MCEIVRKSANWRICFKRLQIILQSNDIVYLFNLLSTLCHADNNFANDALERQYKNLYIHARAYIRRCVTTLCHADNNFANCLPACRYHFA